MKIAQKIVVITGGASGIGAALARQCEAGGAAGIVVADFDLAGAQTVALSLGPTAMAVRCDVSREADIVAVVQTTVERFGRIDVYLSNAGVLGPAGGFELGDEVWDSLWQVNLMAHVWAARALLPLMLSRGEGYFVVTASAAGLLNIIESAPYGVTKHAAVAFAEWLRITYGRRGLRVSCLCPQTVRTPMIDHGAVAGSVLMDGVLSAAEVAQAMLDTMQHEAFLCLPHPEVASYMQNKAADPDRWLGGMQKRHAQHVIHVNSNHNAD